MPAINQFRFCFQLLAGRGYKKWVPGYFSDPDDEINSPVTVYEHCHPPQLYIKYYYLAFSISTGGPYCPGVSPGTF